MSRSASRARVGLPVGPVPDAPQHRRAHGGGAFGGALLPKSTSRCPHGIRFNQPNNVSCRAAQHLGVIGLTRNNRRRTRRSSAIPYTKHPVVTVVMCPLRSGRSPNVSPREPAVRSRRKAKRCAGTHCRLQLLRASHRKRRTVSFSSGVPDGRSTASEDGNSAGPTRHPASPSMKCSKCCWRSAPQLGSHNASLTAAVP